MDKTYEQRKNEIHEKFIVERNRIIQAEREEVTSLAHPSPPEPAPRSTKETK